MEPLVEISHSNRACKVLAQDMLTMWAPSVSSFQDNTIKRMKRSISRREREREREKEASKRGDFVQHACVCPLGLNDVYREEKLMHRTSECFSVI